MKHSTNLPQIINTITDKLTALQKTEMTYLQATSLMAVMRDRIHVQGRDSSGAQIGTYTPAYMRTRIKKGRGSSTKVILSLTRAMEDNYKLYEIPNGTGIGFLTPENMQKAYWCEETYGKKIFAPTAEENAMVVAIAKDYINKIVG